MKDKVIAIDSGIILDSNKVKQRWLVDNLGLELEPWQVNKTECEPQIGAEAYERMRREVFTREGILSHPIKDGIANFLERFRDNKFYMLTVKTPHYLPFLIQWLRAKKLGVDLDVLTAYNTTKACICRKYGIDIIIDDDIRHLKEIPSSISRLFFKPNQPRNELEGIVQLGSWREVGDFLEAKYVATRI